MFKILHYLTLKPLKSPLGDVYLFESEDKAEFYLLLNFRCLDDYIITEETKS